MDNPPQLQPRKPTFHVVAVRADGFRTTIGSLFTRAAAEDSIRLAGPCGVHLWLEIVEVER